MNPYSWHWEHGALTTGLPGKSWSGLWNVRLSCLRFWIRPKGTWPSVCFNLICDNAQANEHAMEKRTSSAGRGGVSFLIWSCNSLRETVSISTSNDYIWVTELFPKVKKGTYWRQTPRHTPALTPWWRGKHCKRRMYRNGGASRVLPHQFNVESALTEHLTNDIPSMYPQYLLTAPTPWRNCMGQITAAWFHMLAPSPTSITKEWQPHAWGKILVKSFSRVVLKQECKKQETCW